MPDLNKPVMTAVITGNHNFEVPGFINLFRSMDDIDFYSQSLENFTADLARVGVQYEALVFYIMHAQLTEAARAVYENLGERQQGLVFLHHGMLAFRDWPLMAEITGVQVQGFKYFHGETVRVEVADPAHPITAGLKAWEMIDETYVLPDAEAPNHILLTTDNPNSVRTLAWMRIYKKARVFVLASGHGNETYSNPNFRTVLHRGILWAAGRI